MNRAYKPFEDIPVKTITLATLFSLFVCFALWVKGFPRPMIDDLFFVGSGVNLATHGSSDNPWIERQGFEGHTNFTHPPLYTALLAFWCRLFVVSTPSLLAFQNCFYFMFCLALIFILCKIGSPSFCCFLPPLVLLASFIHLGLRSEPAAAALMLSGFAACLWSGGSQLRFALGSFLVFLGGSVSSRIGFFSISLILLLFIMRTRFSILLPPKKMLTLLFFTAFLTFLANAWLIDFKIPDFSRVFLFHAKYRTLCLNPFNWAIEKLGLSQIPFLFLTLLFFVYSGAAGWTSKFFWSASVLLFPFIIYGLTGSLGHGLFCFVFLVFLFLASIPVSFSTKPFFLALSFLSLVLAPAKLFLTFYATLSGNIKEPASKAQVWDKIRKDIPESCNILLDSWTMRYLFDYSPPLHSLDWSFSVPFPGTLALESSPQPNDCWIIGPMSMLSASSVFESVRKPDLWAPLGFARFCIPVDLSDFVVVFPSNLNRRLNSLSR